MSKTEGNEQIDDDILQCKEDVLRSRDDITSDAGGEGSVPVKDRSITSKDEVKKTNMEINPVPIETAKPKEPSDLMDAVVEANKKTAAKTPELGQAKPHPDKVLKFDLAEEIMAEQRKITAVKRKSPDKKAKIEPLKPRPAAGDTEESKSKLPERNQIIAEIVARDIESLCRGRQ